MPKKSRKSRVRYKTQGRHKLLSTKEAIRSPQSLPLPSKQAPAAKLPIATAGQADRYRYIASDIKRSLILFAALLALTIALSFFLR